jgi:hypothetical protein
MASEGTVEVPIPLGALQKALGVAGDAILIGGQALAFWMARFDIPIDPADAPRSFVSMDADFLGTHDALNRFAKALRGKAILPRQREITVLQGQVHVPAGDQGFFGVDVVRSVVGLTNAGIESRAIDIELPVDGGVRFRVMDPLDCLVSRLENLRKLKEKQNEVGIWQAQMALRVCRRYMETLIADGNEKRAINAATAILRIAAHAMGVKATKNYGLDIVGTVPIEKFQSRKFKERQWMLATRKTGKGTKK